MREILFRGKRKDNGDWVHGDLSYHHDGRVFTRCWDRLGFDPAYNAYEVNPETVGQFTGLTDKNGKKIFEGDIVLFDYIGRNRGVHGKAAVDFNNGKFGVFWGWHKEFVTLDGFTNTTLEVIGNIHDNPELLEVV